MNERVKITPSHLTRHAIVYLRQSSAALVEHNRESTDRQYALASKARDLGWPDERIIVIDEDLGLSGSGSVARSGFARLTAEVALPAWVSCLVSKSHGSRAIMPNGTD
jgi:DNA invertase Pin-like site-specific DNA recombinase